MTDTARRHGAMCNVLRFRCGGCGRHRSYCLSHQEATRANRCQCNLSVGYVQEERERPPMEVPPGPADEIERLRAALREIRDHPACSYDYHGPPQSDGDRQYQIGVTDGHRLAAKIARRALEDTP